MSSDKKNLTKRLIEDLAVPSEGRTVVYDGQVRGLCVKTESSGGKSFNWYRKIRGAPTWRLLGLFPDLTLEQARGAATAMNNKLEVWRAAGFEGPSPFARTTGLTLAGLMELYVKQKLPKRAKNLAAAEHGLRALARLHIPAEMLARPLARVTFQEVSDLHRRIGARTPRTANRVAGAVKAWFNWARSQKLFSGENPGEGIEHYREESRDRFLSNEELGRLAKALAQTDNQDLKDFVAIALYTGQRRGNIFAMRWRDVLLDQGLWLIPSTKNRTPHATALWPVVMEILKRRRKVLAFDSEYVFPSWGVSGHITYLGKGWSELIKSAGLYSSDKQRVRIHDLRRTHASVMAMQNTSLHIVGRALGHRSSGSTAVYARLAVKPVADAQARANEQIAAAMKAPQPLLEAAPEKTAVKRN